MYPISADPRGRRCYTRGREQAGKGTLLTNAATQLQWLEVPWSEDNSIRGSQPCPQLPAAAWEHAHTSATGITLTLMSLDSALVVEAIEDGLKVQA